MTDEFTDRPDGQPSKPGELSQEEAIAFHDHGCWQDMTLLERAKFQLWQRRLCMPFDKFHEAVEHALGRPVFTHEFAYRDLLRKELMGERWQPSLEEIIELIPAHKRMIVRAPPNKQDE
jgi:hypothetical protein